MSQDTSNGSIDSSVVEKQQKEKANKESKKKNTNNSETEKTSQVSIESNVEQKVSASGNKKKPNKEAKKRKFEVEAEYSMSNERLKAYGLNPKKLKKKLFNQKINPTNE